ncbi:MAG: hypothetical protein ACK5U4_01500, partial [Rhodospirillales bacterium]
MSQQVRRTLIAGALVVRAKLHGYAWERADLLIDGDSIAAIEAPGSVAPARADETLDGARLLVLPGLINGHVHSWDHYLKG